jgi:hypothetical protein
VRRPNPLRLRDLWEDEGEEEFVLEMLKITAIATTQGLFSLLAQVTNVQAEFYSPGSSV